MFDEAEFRSWRDYTYAWLSLHKEEIVTTTPKPSPNKSSSMPFQWYCYAFGTLGYTIVATALLIMHPYRYDPGQPNPYDWPVLAPSAFVGFAALISRSFNSLAGVYIGHLSDQSNLRWGRRRPFLALAIIPMLLSFILVFIPPVASLSIWNAIYLAITLTLFFLFLAVYSTPYSAFLVEIASTSEERLKLSTLLAVFMLIGNTTGLVATPWLVSQLGFTKMSLLLGGISLASLSMPLMVQEDMNAEARYLHSKKSEAAISFGKSIRIALGNIAFRQYLMALFPVWITMSAIFFSGNYFVVALLRKGIEYVSILNFTILIGVLLGFPIITRLAKSLDKKAAFQFALTGLSLGLAGVSIWSVTSSKSVWSCLLLMLLCGIFMSSFYILPNPMVADIIDKDAQHAEHQRGAIFFGIISMFMVITSGFSALLTGILLMLGKTAEHPLGIQLVYPISAILIFWSSQLMRRYTLYK